MRTEKVGKKITKFAKNTRKGTSAELEEDKGRRSRRRNRMSRRRGRIRLRTNTMVGITRGITMPLFYC